MFWYRSNRSRAAQVPRPFDAAGPIGARRSLVRFTAATVVFALLALFLPLGARPATAASVSAASFTGDNKTLKVDGILYAKKQAGLTLNVTTATAAKCVEISGDHAAKQTSNTAKTSWSFSFTAGDGNGVKNVTVHAFDNIGTPCTNGTGSGSHKSMDASYVLDNTGATASASLSAPANAAGWNNSSVAITWTGTDSGVGFTRNCDGPGNEHNPKPCTDTVGSATNGTTKTANATDRLGNAGGGSVVVRIDTQAPTITGSRSPAQPTSGWNNTDVTVSFSCEDPKQGVTKDNAGFASGITTCGPNQTVSTSGANQSVTGKAIDAADNEVSATVSNINIDKVAPTVTGAASTLPNADGWYKGDVSVGWTCSDPLSGLAGACPGNSTIGGEGEDLGATSPSVSDKAGNTGSGSVRGINIDRTAPNTATNATTNWNNQDVTVVLTPSDNLSEVKSTHYTLNGGAEQTGTSVPVGTDGTHTLRYWSVDNAGNVEAPKTVEVKIDKTEPSISHTQAPAANGNGWNNTDVTVTFTCVDGGSGINSCTQPVTVTTEGQDQPVPGTAVDNAGNTATDPATVSIDKTAPTISAAADREANGNGWYKSDVTVSFTCGDQLGLSGVAVCPAAQTLGEGTNQSASGTATDAADNPASASVTDINVDKTAPTLTGAAQGTPTNGWYNDDVTVVWSCDDAGGSGLDGTCPSNNTVSGEGENGSASASVSDKAGNSTSATVSDIKIDRTAPITTATVPAAFDSWHASPVQVTLSASDNLSQVATTYYSLNGGAAQVYSGGITLVADRTHTIVFWSVDQAGNVEDAEADGHSVEVQVDNIKPSITGSVSPAANATGWYTDAPTVSFACEDAVPGSGIKHCRADGEEANSKLLGEGRDQSVSGTATDNVGNTNQTIVRGIDVDLTDPVNIGFIGGPDAGAEYTVGSVPGGPACTAEDAVSEIASCLVSGYGTSEGSHTLTATATDNAGRTATATRTYAVVAATVAPSWTASGFYRPIEMSSSNAASAHSIWNTAKNGSTIPFKFEVFAGPNQTNEVSDTSKITMTAKQIPCPSGATLDAVEELASGATSIRYDSTAGQFIYNWKTPTKANTCWQMIMKANGGEAVIDNAFILLR